ncbi:DUF3618 domain-containing protein [Streptomyces sp. SID14478]|uniref:DUF3618 domain-containing protein n=1 Tax=Streptomyces sp. SID14478 TaxID=2706073 RepID=UPI0013D99331|nr:DUF3618 domain-containing protein [Streptomyces sp. SID14478]NEB73675.1 DUF3618 domain-containing protein [Streptomyces sp. SID14478]
MTQPPHDEQTASSPEELREQIEQTRTELGHTVEALAAKADVKARAKDKATHLKEQATDRTDALKAQATATAGKARTRAVGLAHQARQQTPEPLRQWAAQGARTAQNNRTVLLATVSTGALVLWLSLRRRGGKPRRR